MMNLIGVSTFDKTSKMFESLVARSNNLIRGSLNQKIFFSHIPKCGGTSINKAIKNCYLTLDITKDNCLAHANAKATFDTAQRNIDQTSSHFNLTDDYPALKLREDLLLYYMCQEDVKYISGHIPFSARAYQYFPNKYAFVTVLRDPVKRWISAYFYNRYRQEGHRKIETDLEPYMKSEFGKSRGYAYVKFVGGPNEEGDYTSEQAITRAKENLHKFTVVGCLEYKQDFVKQFEKQFGRRLKIGISNQSPKSKINQSSIITDKIKEEIREICRPDIEIYQYAIDNFVEASFSYRNQVFKPNEMIRV